MITIAFKRDADGKVVDGVVTPPFLLSLDFIILLAIFLINHSRKSFIVLKWPHLGFHHFWLPPREAKRQCR